MGLTRPAPMVGVANADPDQIRTAQEVLGGRLVSVQNQLSPAFRSSEPEIDLCAEMGIAFLPWSPLGGIGSAGGLGPEHAAFAEIARDRGVTPQQVGLRRCASSRRSSACTSSGTPQDPLGLILSFAPTVTSGARQSGDGP